MVVAFWGVLAFWGVCWFAGIYPGLCCLESVRKCNRCPCYTPPPCQRRSHSAATIRAASGAADGSVLVWDMEAAVDESRSQPCVALLRGHKSTVTGLAFDSPGMAPRPGACMINGYHGIALRPRV